jgi:hypothetical protein
MDRIIGLFSTGGYLSEGFLIGNKPLLYCRKFTSSPRSSPSLIERLSIYRARIKFFKKRARWGEGRVRARVPAMPKPIPLDYLGAPLPA